MGVPIGDVALLKSILSESSSNSRGSELGVKSCEHILLLLLHKFILSKIKENVRQDFACTITIVKFYGRIVELYQYSDLLS